MIRIEGLGDRVSRAALPGCPESLGQKSLQQTAAQCFKGKCPRKEHDAFLADVKTMKFCGALSTAGFKGGFHRARLENAPSAEASGSGCPPPPDWTWN